MWKRSKNNILKWNSKGRKKSEILFSFCLNSSFDLFDRATSDEWKKPKQNYHINHIIMIKIAMHNEYNEKFKRMQWTTTKKLKNLKIYSNSFAVVRFYSYISSALKLNNPTQHLFARKFFISYNSFTLLPSSFIHFFFLFLQLVLPSFCGYYIVMRYFSV